MPTTNSAPNHGVPAARPWRSSSCLANGVITMPPTDSPVDATDSAIDRFAWNHLVTTVVAGTRPAAAQPAANTAYTTKSCPCCSTWPSTPRASPPTTPPPTITTRTSYRAIQRAIHTPLTPPTTKNTVVASEIVLNGQSRSLLNAFR